MPGGPHSSSGTARLGAGHAGSAVGRSDWRSRLARSGLVAKGVLYGAIGLLAIQVAAGEASSGSASRRGAIELVASQPFGQWLLGLLTLGLFALAVWQVVLAFTGDPVEGSEAKDRAKFAGKAVIYLATASTALTILAANWGASTARGGVTGGGSGEGSEDQAAATVMSWPGGEWIVGLVGLAVLGAGIYQFREHAWKRQFMHRLNAAEMSPEVAAGVERAGRLGYTARAIVLAVVGIFFVVAAAQHDPQEAVGLSGALHAVSQQAWGEGVLWLVAVGLFLYGCFCFAEAKYRRGT